ncbi:MAG TPA: hypothetical protein ENJ80_01710 [Gammaproteobacteria bacterium]|nr:hypothetical protein [Gammaproteobacteria bacterium]
MPTLQLTIPAQDGNRPGRKIKPREVHEWLENLPYLDLKRAARLASEQLRLMNRQPLSPAARAEMLGDFLGTYQRLGESLPGRQDENNLLRPRLKRLCQDICFGYKIITHELVNKRGGFIETRSLPLALLGAIYTLGLQLMHYYANYQRAPRALWSECLMLYKYAWQSGREHYTTSLPGSGECQIDTSFRLIATLRLADPYHLPPGMAPVLHHYFHAHSDLGRIVTEAESESGAANFRLSDRYADDSPDDPLFLDLTALMEQMAEDIDKLEQYRQARAIGLPAEIPALPLLQTLRKTLEHWRILPTRKTEREETSARIELVSGLDAAYCMVNRGRRFDPSLFLAPGHENVIDLGARPVPENTDQGMPESFACTGINRCSGGLALRYRGTRKPHPRVGQLVALHRPGARSGARWVVAVGRWLVEPESGSGFDLGLQYLVREPRPVVIRVLDEAGLGGDFQPAIGAVQKRGENRLYTLLTRGGSVRPGDKVVIYDQAEQLHAECTELLESGPGFERLVYRPADENSDAG